MEDGYIVAYMRLWPAVLMLVACTSDPVAAPTPVQPEEAGVVTDAGTSPLTDTGTPVAEDASVEACVPPPASTDLPSDDCAVMGPCPTCADGFLYECTGAGQPKVRSKDPLPGCRRLSLNTSTGDATYCCPAACVRHKSRDVACFVGRPSAIVCPAKDDGTSLVGDPSGACSFTSAPTPGGTATAYCCD